MPMRLQILLPNEVFLDRQIVKVAAMAANGSKATSGRMRKDASGGGAWRMANPERGNAEHTA